MDDQGKRGISETIVSYRFAEDVYEDFDLVLRAFKIVPYFVRGKKISKMCFIREMFRLPMFGGSLNVFIIKHRVLYSVIVNINYLISRGVLLYSIISRFIDRNKFRLSVL